MTISIHSNSVTYALPSEIIDAKRNDISNNINESTIAPSIQYREKSDKEFTASQNASESIKIFSLKAKILGIKKG